MNRNQDPRTLYCIFVKIFTHNIEEAIRWSVKYTLFHLRPSKKLERVYWVIKPESRISSDLISHPDTWYYSWCVHLECSTWGSSDTPFIIAFYTGYRLQLKCDGTRWRMGGEVKGKLANGVGSQYSSHYLVTWCIQHYYRWCAHLGCQ